MIKRRLQCYRDQDEKNMISDMKKSLLNVCLLFPFLLITHYKPVLPGVYDWKQPLTTANKNISTSVMFEGSAFEMKWLQMTANTLKPSDKTVNLTVPATEEQLYIIKKGTLDITMGDSSFSLSNGSVVVMAPGERFSIRNKQSAACEFFIMNYKSQLAPDKERGEKAGGTIIKNWNNVEFKPHDKGGVRTFFERPTAMLKRLEMHVTTLNAGLKSHAPHTHTAKEIIVMKEGDTEMQIGDKTFKGKEGSVYFMESNVLHGITNIGTTPCTYFAIQFE
jgi:(S)-ureidoglycine aminohydrolase